MSTSPEFVAWFRSAAPYIRTFRGQTFVIAFDGDVIDEGNFTDLTHDINLLVSVGVRVVLVHGARPQIERSLKSKKLKSNFSNHQIRVTDEETLTCVKEANGRLRWKSKRCCPWACPIHHSQEVLFGSRLETLL